MSGPTAAPGAWHGGQVTPRAHCLRQDNPGPMTLDGTNTWVLLEPGSDEAVVLDPGEDEPAHQERVLRHVADRGARVALVLLTHGHHDHVGGAPFVTERTGAPVRGAGHDDPGDGEVLDVGGLRLRVVTTPGHTADSICVVLPDDDALLTGDTVLGRGTSVVAHPDGRLGDYLATLDRLASLTGDGGLWTILPGHGPTVTDAAEVVRYYAAHRRERLEQVRSALADGATGADDVVERVYADVDRSLWPAARLSVQAQLDHLSERDAGDARRR